MQPLQTLRTHARTLAMASMLALAVVSLPAVQAHAQPVQGNGDFGSCVDATTGQTYYPGERVFGMDGHTRECQWDGSWKVVDLVVSPGHRLPVAPERTTGVAVAP